MVNYSHQRKPLHHQQTLGVKFEALMCLGDNEYSMKYIESEADRRTLPW